MQSELVGDHLRYPLTSVLTLAEVIFFIAACMVI